MKPTAKTSASNGTHSSRLEEAIVDNLERTLRASAKALRQARAARGRAERDLQALGIEVRRSLLVAADSRQHEIGLELHDHIGATLAGVALLVRGARQQHSRAAAEKLLARAQDELQAATQAVRRLASGLMPAGVEPGGLVEALSGLAGLLADNDVRCDFRFRGRVDLIDVQSATHVSRIVQEAVNNAIRHGGATQVRIRLAAAGARYRLRVLDDGRGFVVPRKPSGVGLRSMQARADVLGGTLELVRRPRGGSAVRLTWTGGRDGEPGL